MRPEPVQVQANDGRPARFVWRGRLYTVISVVQRPGERRTAVAADEAESEPITELRCWLVTASPGRNVPAVVFRLCQDPVTDRWQLSRNGS